MSGEVLSPVRCPWCGALNAMVLPPTRVEMVCKGRRCGMRIIVIVELARAC